MGKESTIFERFRKKFAPCCSLLYCRKKFTKLSEPKGLGGPKILAHQLTALIHPGADYAHQITAFPLGFSYLPTTLSSAAVAEYSWNICKILGP